MGALSAAQAAPASTDWRPPVNSRQVLSTRLQRMGGQEVARAIHKDESTASRILSGERGCTIEDFCTLLELVGLKLVSKEKHCIAADELRMLRRVYTTATSRDLLWEDPE